MILYLVTFLFSCVLFVIAGKKKNLQLVALVASFLILWIVASFRDYSVGLDTIPYKEYFDSVVVDQSKGISFDWLNPFNVIGFESGFMFLNYLVSFISDNFTIFLMVAHALILLPIFYLIKKKSKNFFLSYAIYFSLFFLGSMNHLRQAIAMSIIFLGFSAIIKRQLVRYILIVLLATLIHQSAIVMIIPYFLYGLKFNSRWVLYISVMGVLALVAIGPLLQILATGNFRYELYLGKLDSIQLGSFIVTSFIGLISLLTLRLGFIVRKMQDSKETLKLVNFYMFTAFVAFVVSVVSIRFSGLDRLTSYFLMYSILGLPLLAYLSKIKMNATVKLVFIICALIYTFTLLILKPEWLGVSEYILQGWG